MLIAYALCLVCGATSYKVIHMPDGRADALAHCKAAIPTLYALADAAAERATTLETAAATNPEAVRRDGRRLSPKLTRQLTDSSSSISLALFRSARSWPGRRAPSR